jgi:hypothetical protein
MTDFVASSNVGDASVKALDEELRHLVSGLGRELIDPDQSTDPESEALWRDLEAAGFRSGGIEPDVAERIAEMVVQLPIDEPLRITIGREGLDQPDHDPALDPVGGFQS